MNRPIQIEIVNTGSELMLGYVLNTHQQWLCRELSRRGYMVARQVAIDDSGPAIVAAVQEAMQRADLILVTGGLGPTSDDRTRDLISGLLGRPLREDAAIIAHIENFFGRRKRLMPASTRVQALVPEGAAVLMNANGTAPGLVMRFDGPSGAGLLIMLPGPPRELRPMFTAQALPEIEKTFGPAADFACTVLKSTGIGESFLEEKVATEIAPLLQRGLEVGYCARVGEVDLRFTARGANARELVEQAEKIAHRALRGFIYGAEPDLLETVVVRLLTSKSKTVALAESCTGGFIANRITNVPGASAVFLAGVVSYANSAKESFLGVDPALIDEHGAVSEPVARAMAEGVRRASGADYALATTGIAGPEGGSPEKPVGTVFVALAGPNETRAKKLLNQYDRETFKFVTSQQALDLLRHELLGL